MNVMELRAKWMVGFWIVQIAAIIGLYLKK